MRANRFIVSLPLLIAALAALLALPACGNADAPTAKGAESAAYASTLMVSSRPAGHVIRVADGDTVTILSDDRQQQRIRLAEIDTPERHQAWGGNAKRALSKLVYGKPIAVSVHDIDRYGRIVATVYVNGHDINAEMVRLGHAWVYRQYLKRPELLAIEEDARRARRGLWALPESERMPPWQWRKQQREAGAK